MTTQLTEQLSHERLAWYLELLECTYEEAIQKLFEKHGKAKHAYFDEKAYHAFLRGERKTITKTRESRTSEGLYCHHILEDRALRLSHLPTIKLLEYPYEFQSADNLVYCNAVEHAILHLLITLKTDFKFGYPGFATFLLPELKDWYLFNKVPTVAWQKNCYDAAWITKFDLFTLYQAMGDKLNEAREALPKKTSQQEQSSNKERSTC